MTKQKRAYAAILTLLQSGPMPSKMLFAQLAALDISRATAMLAREQLGERVRAWKASGGHSWWRLNNEPMEW